MLGIRDILVRIPDPRIRTCDLRIRIWILLISSVSFKTPTKNYFLRNTFCWDIYIIFED
jgi:hypothetical protein